MTQHCEAEDSSAVRFLFPLHPICYHRFPFAKPKPDESAEEEWAQCSMLGPRAGTRGAIRAHQKQICIAVLTPSSGYENPLLLQQYQGQRGDITQIILLFGTVELWMGQRRGNGWVSRKNEPFIGLQSSTVSHPQANTDLTVRGQGLKQEEEETMDP